MERLLKWDNNYNYSAVLERLLKRDDDKYSDDGNGYIFYLDNDIYENLQWGTLQIFWIIYHSDWLIDFNHWDPWMKGKAMNYLKKYNLCTVKLRCMPNDRWTF